MQIWSPPGHKIEQYSCMPSGLQSQRMTAKPETKAGYDAYIEATYGPTGLNILTHYWPLNESSGNAIDAIAALNGTLAGITQGSGSILPTTDGETSYTATGASSTRVSMSSNFGAYPKSYEAWIKPTVISSAITNGIFQDGGTSNGIYIACIGSLGWTGAFASGGGANNYVASSLTANTVYHFVLTATSTTVKIYLNGVSQTVTSSGSPPAPSTASSALMGGSASGGFDGLAEKFAVYNAVLTQAQVTNNYNKGLNG